MMNDDDLEKLYDTLDEFGAQQFELGRLSVREESAQNRDLAEDYYRNYRKAMKMRNVVIDMVKDFLGGEGANDAVSVSVKQEMTALINALIDAAEDHGEVVAEERYGENAVREYRDRLEKAVMEILVKTERN